MPPVGFEPTISAGERPQTHALDRAATGTGCFRVTQVKNREYLRPNSTVGTTEYRQQTTYFKYLQVLSIVITSCHLSGECLVL